MLDATDRAALRAQRRAARSDLDASAAAAASAEDAASRRSSESDGGQAPAPRTPRASLSSPLSSPSSALPSLAQSLGYAPRGGAFGDQLAESAMALPLARPAAAGAASALSPASSYGGASVGAGAGGYATPASHFFRGAEGTRALAASTAIQAPAPLDSALALQQMQLRQQQQRIEAIQRQQGAAQQRHQQNLSASAAAAAAAAPPSSALAHAGQRLFTLTGGAAMHAQHAAHSLQLSAAAAAASSSGLAQVTPVYEESIATGDFKRVNGGLESAAAAAAAGAGAAAAFLRARVAKRLRAGLTGSFSGMDEDDDTSLAAGLTDVVAAVCRSAQGLLVGLLLLAVLQLGALPPDSTGAATLAFFGPTASQMRFAMWVLSVLAWLGATDEALRVRGVLGRLLPPHNAAAAAAAASAQAAALSPASAEAGNAGHAGGGGRRHRGPAAGPHLAPYLALAAESRAVAISCACFSGVLATVLATMPSDVAMRQASTAMGAAPPTSAIATWRSAVLARFVFAMAGWLASAWGVRSPISAFQAVQEMRLADADEEAVAAAAAAAAAAAGGGGVRGGAAAAR